MSVCRPEVGGPGEAHLDGFKPAWLLDLVVDNRLVLHDPVVPSAREDHVLQEGRRESHASPEAFT